MEDREDHTQLEPIRDNEKPLPTYDKRRQNQPLEQLSQKRPWERNIYSTQIHKTTTNRTNTRHQTQQRHCNHISNQSTIIQTSTFPPPTNHRTQPRPSD